LVLCKGQSFQKTQILVHLHLFSCDSFYNIPGVADNKNRKAAIGYGKKTDLDVGKDPHNIAPSPDTYNLKSFVETNEAHSKGFTPLVSR